MSSFLRHLEPVSQTWKTIIGDTGRLLVQSENVLNGLYKGELWTVDGESNLKADGQLYGKAQQDKEVRHLDLSFANIRKGSRLKEPMLQTGTWHLDIFLTKSETTEVFVASVTIIM